MEKKPWKRNSPRFGCDRCTYLSMIWETFASICCGVVTNMGEYLHTDADGCMVMARGGAWWRVSTWVVQRTRGKGADGTTHAPEHQAPRRLCKSAHGKR